jgi:hypothetical protein
MQKSKLQIKIQKYKRFFKTIIHLCHSGEGWNPDAIPNSNTAATTEN